MGIKLNTEAYRKLISEDIEWLKKQPRSLEQEHILAILEYESQHLPMYYHTSTHGD